MTAEPMIRFRCQALRPSGATDIRVVQATSAEAARERLIAVGLEPVSIEAIGPSLFAAMSARLSEHIRRRDTSRLRALAGRRFNLPGPFIIPNIFATAVPIFAATSVTLMVASWSLAWATDWRFDRLASERAGPLARYEEQMAIDRARRSAVPAMTAPGLSEISGRLAALLPPDSGLVEAQRESTGVLRIEIDTPDPDRIRPVLAGDPLFASLREIGQAPTTEGTMRVIWTDGSR